MKLEEVVGQRDERPLGSDLREPPHQESAKASRLLDLTEDGLGDHFSPRIDGRALFRRELALSFSKTRSRPERDLERPGDDLEFGIQGEILDGQVGAGADGRPGSGDEGEEAPNHPPILRPWAVSWNPWENPQDHARIGFWSKDSQCHPQTSHDR